MDNKEDYARNATNGSSIILHVCRTGKKEQYYTLYIEGITIGKYGRNYFQHYEQNLSYKKEVAMEKAENRKREFINSGFWQTVEIQYHESPRMVYNKMEAFGATFKTSKSGTTMWAKATPEFWELWNTKEQEIRDAGFWIKKYDYDWLIFCRVEAKFDYS